MARHWLYDEPWPVLTPDPSEPLPHDRLMLVPGNHDVDRGRSVAVGANSSWSTPRS